MSFSLSWKSINFNNVVSLKTQRYTSIKKCCERRSSERNSCRIPESNCLLFCWLFFFVFYSVQIHDVNNCSSNWANPANVPEQTFRDCLSLSQENPLLIQCILINWLSLNHLLSRQIAFVNHRMPSINHIPLNQFSYCCWLWHERAQTPSCRLWLFFTCYHPPQGKQECIVDFKIIFCCCITGF